MKLACVWTGELVSVLTSSILQMGFVWHITLSTGSAGMLSLASLTGFLPLALFGTFAGVIVDRLPLKRVLVGADLFIAGVSAVVALVSLTGTLPVGVVVAALFFRAVGSAFHTPAFQTLTPLVAPAEYLTRLSGVTQAVQSGGYILGTAVAAVIYPLWGLTAMIALDVAGALIATGAVLVARLDAGCRGMGAPMPSRQRRRAPMPTGAGRAVSLQPRARLWPRRWRGTASFAGIEGCFPCSGAASPSRSFSRPSWRSSRS